MLDQSAQLDAIDLSDAGAGPGAAPPLGAYLTYQVPVADVAALTGLDLARGSAVLETRWLRLRHVDDVVL